MRFLALPLFLIALLLPASLLHADGHDETTDARVDRLEKEVALLQAQLKALQAEVQALRAQVAGTQPTEKPDTPARDDVLVGSWRIDIPATMARMKAAGASQAKIDGVQEMGAVMTLIIDLDEDGTFYVGMSTNGQVRETAAGTSTRDGRTFRMMNEVPTIFMFIIVISVIARPF